MTTERLVKRGKESQDFSKIESTIAMLRNFLPQKPVSNAVIYFWESHNKHPDEKEKTQATIDLIYKEFDLSTCEKYEARTGYLSRYNHMLKPLADCTADEIKEAIVKWLSRCQPDLPGFTEKNWEDCINNPFYEDCRNFVINKMDNDAVFANAFSKSIADFALTHSTNETNSKLYIIEETSWILSLPLLHLNKPVYLIHIGSANSAVVAIFHHFPNLQKVVKRLSPRFSVSSFENISEFLLDYRNAFHVGHSYAIENKESIREITNFRKEEESFQKNIQRALEDERRKNNLLESIINKLPVNTYWLNRNMVYMGCNDLQAQRLGLSSKKEIIGKTNYDLHSVEEADELNRINNIVMITSTSYESEEVVFTKSIGKLCTYLSRKTPLFDINGKIIGLLGLSIDITDRKKREEAEIKIREELYNVAKYVSHGYSAARNCIERDLDLNKSLSREEKRIFNEVARNIENIADRLLTKYRGEKDVEERQYVLVTWCLERVISQKREQYKEKDIEFKSSLDSANKFVFIKGNFVDFSRMISNLLSNAVEEIDNKKGIIRVEYRVNGDEVEIKIKDNGKGMPKEMAEKLVKGLEVGTTKEDGHGIGTQQIMSAIKEMNGRVKIESKENVGTEFIITFAKTQSPKWFADKIEIKKGDTVVILDDDPLMYKIWKEKLKKYDKEITLKFFKKGLEALKYLKSLENKEKAFLIADYELQQDINGIDVIEGAGMKDRHALVTSAYLSDIKDFSKKSEYLKIFYKTQLDDVSVKVN